MDDIFMLLVGLHKRVINAHLSLSDLASNPQLNRFMELVTIRVERISTQI